MADLPEKPRDAQGEAQAETDVETPRSTGDVPAAEEAPPAPAPAAAPVDGPQARRETGRLREWVRIGVGGNRWAVVVLAPLALMVGGYAWLWMTGEPAYVPQSRIGVGSDVAPNPLEPTSEAYRIALEAGETDRREEAVEAGESFVPALQSRDAMVETPVVLDPVSPAATAPSERVRAEVGQAVEAALGGEAPEPEPDPFVERRFPEPREVGTELVRAQTTEPAAPDALGVMFEDLFKVWDAPPPKMVVVRYEGARNDTPPGPAPAQGTGDTAVSEVAQRSPDGPSLVPAGKMLYAVARVGVDSELGLPVLVELLERPFSGALLRGEFAQVRDRMMIRFSRLSDPRRGLEVDVDAYAVGLDCACGAVDGEVDRHWFARVVLPAAVGFTEGYLDASGRPEVAISVDGQVITQRTESESSQRVAAGLAGAARRAGDVLLEGAPKRATVRLARGTELAVVFVEAVRAPGEARG